MTGRVLVNGERQPENFKCMSGYVVQVKKTITIPEIFTSLIFERLIFVVVYYSQSQVAVNIRCSKSWFKFDF